MMSMHDLRATLVIELASPLLAGGHTSPASDVDATTARDGQAFIIPASALRGALREACVRLENARSNTPPDPEGGPLTRTLFGAPGRDRPRLTDGTKGLAVHAETREPTGGSGALRLTDARSHEAALPLSVRHGVGIDRYTGAASPERHFQREVAGSPGQELTATLTLDFRAAEEAEQREAVQLLRDAMALVEGVGNSQSRGLGQLRVRFGEGEPPPIRRALEIQGSKQTGLLVDVEAYEPLLLGGMPSPSNVKESLPFVPGSTLRGALGAAVLKSGVSADDPAFQRAFVESTTCVLFSDALPVGRGASPDELPLVSPRSRLACKHANEDDHRGGLVARDTLILGALATRVAEVGGVIQPFLCEVCGRPLTTARGWVPYASPAQRVVTRLGRDAATGSFSPGLLYTTIQVEKGARFRGTIARLEPEARALLERIQGDVRLGGMRNRGLGGVRVTLRPSAQLGAGAVKYRRRQLTKRIRPLLAAARDLGAAGLPQSADALLPVVARTDLAIAPVDAPNTIGRMIFGGQPFTLLGVAQATDVRSGWSDIDGGPRALRPVVAAGSAWLFAFEGPGPSDEVLAQLELDGIESDGRELGLGRIAIAPRVLVEGWK